MSRITNVLQKLNKDTAAEVYYVGGFVRDLVRRKKPNNVDIVICHYPIKDIVKYLKEHGEIKKVNSLHCDMIFSCNGDEVRISIPRNGKKKSPFYSLKNDARSRDFTVNAMYLPIDRRSKKHIIDYYGGLNDIKERRLRAVGNIEAMLHTDPIRGLRVISFSSWLSYKIDTNLFYGVKAAAKLLDKADVHEKRDELIKVLLSKKPSKYIRLLYSTGLLYFLIPELHACYGMEQNKKYHKHDVFTHSILACDNTEPDIILRLAALLHDIGKLQTRDEQNSKVTFYSHEVISARLSKRILKRLDFNHDIIVKVMELTYLHMYNYEPDKWTDSAVRRFIKKAKIQKEDLDKLDTFPLFLVRRADRLANGYTHKEVSYRQSLLQKRILDTFEQSNVLTISDLDIDGGALMKEFKLKEGPTIGNILNYLLSIVLDDQKLNSREILIEEASKYLSDALK